MSKPSPPNSGGLGSSTLIVFTNTKANLPVFVLAILASSSLRGGGRTFSNHVQSTSNTQSLSGSLSETLEVVRNAAHSNRLHASQVTPSASQRASHVGLCFSRSTADQTPKTSLANSGIEGLGKSSKTPLKSLNKLTHNSLKTDQLTPTYLTTRFKGVMEG